MHSSMLTKQAAASLKESAIDFKTMLAKERQRAGQDLALKQTTPVNVFNMLQDMRHLIILDLRTPSDFSTSHIRMSLNVTVDTFKDQLTAAMLMSS